MAPPDPEPIIIACAADAGYVQPLAVMLQSVFANLSPDRRAEVYVLDGGIHPHQRNALVRSLGPRGMSVHWVPATESRFAGAPLWGRMSAATYFKLGLADLLPATMRKAIWLDCDLVVTGDLARLWDAELAGRHVLAVQDSIVPFVSSRCGVAGYETLGIPRDAKYFNAGVMVLDVARWRADDVSARALAYLRRYRDRVFFFDQEGLNAVLAGKWGELDARWNYNASVPESRQSREGEGDPWVVHFAGMRKPWLYPSADRYRLLYYRYLDMTPWAGWRPRRRLLATMMELYGSSRVRGALYPLEHWWLLLRRASSRTQVTGATKQEAA